MSKWGTVKEIVMKTLSDGLEHSYTELRDAVTSVDAELLITENTLSAVLYQMMQKDKRIVRTGKAVYRYMTDACVTDGDESSEASLYEEALRRSQALMAEIDASIDRPSYDMSEKEFASKKQMYRLSKALHQALDPFL